MTNTTYPQAGKFIDPLSDWGFRHYFGSEPNKEILIGFLNDLFEGEKYIEDLEYGPTEHDGDDGEDKRIIFDLHCKGKNGEFFIIETRPTTGGCNVSGRNILKTGHYIIHHVLSKGSCQKSYLTLLKMMLSWRVSEINGSTYSNT